MDWLTLNYDSSLVRLAQGAARLLIPARAVMRIRSGPNAGFKWIAGSGIHRCWLGGYEVEKQLAMVNFVHSGAIAYDIGAHAGFYTLLFSRLAGASGLVYSFEPCARNVEFLMSHTKINHLDNVRIVQAAVTDTTGLSGMTTLTDSYQNRLCGAQQAQLLVPTVTLDSLTFPPPEILKIDVEGAEAAVLNGARRILKEHRPIVFLALHGDRQRRECADVLYQLNYALRTLEGKEINGLPASDEIYALPPG